MKVKIITLISSLIFCNALIAGSSDMSVSLTTNSDSFFAGQRSVITATINNLGPDTATNIQVNLAINSPIAITDITVDSILENCQISPSGINCSLNTLDLNQLVALKISFIPPISDISVYSMHFIASVNSDNSDDNQANNNSSSTIQVTSTPTQEQWGNALLDVLGADRDRLRQMVGALAAYCGTNNNYETDLSGNCDDLFIQALNGNVELIKRVLRRLRPREVVQQARTSVQIIATQQANIAARMAQVRAGSANSIAGLSFSSGSDTLPIGMLGYLADGSDSSYDQFVTPWGFFINGQFSSGDYSYADARDEGFDFDTDGITAGIDYRLNAKSVVGLAMGYANFDSNVGTEATMSSSALTFSAYGSFNINDNFYIDARSSYGKPEFDQQRVVQFNIGDSQVDKNAIGQTEGTQQSVIISSGYQFNKNGWQLTPSVRDCEITFSNMIVNLHYSHFSILSEIHD